MLNTFCENINEFSQSSILPCRLSLPRTRVLIAGLDLAEPVVTDQLLLCTNLYYFNFPILLFSALPELNIVNRQSVTCHSLSCVCVCVVCVCVCVRVAHDVCCTRRVVYVLQTMCCVYVAKCCVYNRRCVVYVLQTACSRWTHGTCSVTTTSWTAIPSSPSYGQCLTYIVPLFLSLSFCLPLFLSLSFSLLLCPSRAMFICLCCLALSAVSVSVLLSLSVSVFMCLTLSRSVSICLCFYLSGWLCLCLSVSLSLSLSVSLSLLRSLARSHARPHITVPVDWA